MRTLLVLTAIVAAACATPRSGTHPTWRMVGDGAQPLDQARAACKAVAMERSASVVGQSLAAKAAAGAFAECMRERGWALVDQD